LPILIGFRFQEKSTLLMSASNFKLGKENDYSGFQYDCRIETPDHSPKAVSLSPSNYLLFL
jgi:hypothetical protein